MKVTTNAGKLLAIVASVTGIIARANTLPILGNVLIRCGEHSLSVTGTDLEVTIQTKSDLTEIESGASTVPAAKLVAILAALPDAATVTLSASESDPSALLKAGSSRYSLRTLPSDDYPTTTSKGVAIGAVALDAVELRSALERVAPFMAVNDVRYYMNGVYMDPTDRGIAIVATDGHRMSVVDLACAGEKRFAHGILVPGKTIKMVLRLLPKSGEVQISQYENIIRFDLGDTRIHSKTIDAQYPAYKRVLPVRTGLTQVKRADLLDALNRASILCSERFRGVTLLPQAGQIAISAKNDAQEQSDEEIFAEVPDTEHYPCGFNVDYLLTAVQVAKGDDMHLSFGSADESLLFTDPSFPAWRAVVMPMRV